MKTVPAIRITRGVLAVTCERAARDNRTPIEFVEIAGAKPSGAAVAGAPLLQDGK